MEVWAGLDRGVAELGRGTVVSAGWVGWGELGHHEVPDGGPGGAGGGDEELGWEGRTPEDFGEAGDGICVVGHFDCCSEVSAVGGGVVRREDEGDADK